MNEINVSEKYTRAVLLHKRITANVQAAQESLWEVCRDLKEIRDGRLFEELGYTVFEDYCTKEFELSYKQACKYIAVAERYPDGISPGRLGISKLYLISTLTDEERSELESSIDIEQASKSELEKEIKELKERNKALEEEKQVTFDKLAKLQKEQDNEPAKKRIEYLEGKLDEQKKLTETESKQRDDAARRASVAETDLREKKVKIEQLEKKIKGLEAGKPETVAVEDTTEIERLKKELAKAEKKLSEATKPDTVTQTVEVHDDIDEFRAHFTVAVDSISRISEFMKNHADSKNYPFFKGKLAALADKIKKEIFK
jgi:DNA repair exonuclease SbcCD ATPase subunit